MIGFLQQPTGRLGNVLLQYLFMREIAGYTNVDYFHPTIKGHEYFDGLSETENYSFVKGKIFGKRKIKNRDICERSLKTLICEIKTSNKIYILEPPVLGHTFESLYKKPSEYISIKEELQIPYFDYAGKYVIALHFRGTDFAEWNSNACLEPKYYTDAISYCVNKYGNLNLVFSLFTDDTTIDSYKTTIQYLDQHSLCYYEGDPLRNLGTECYNISISDIVVSSPSTFAILSTLLGKEKKVIHSKKWCEYCLETNDKVWIQMLTNKCQYYQIDQLI